MKQLLFIMAFLPVLAMAQTEPVPVQSYTLADSSFYTKLKTNFNGALAVETGLSGPLFSQGNLMFSSNLGYVQDVDNLWNDNSWTLGLKFSYRLDKDWAVYTKTNTNFTGDWNQESGLQYNLFTAPNYSVNANAGYVFEYPYRHYRNPQWTAGVTFSFPVGKLAK